VVGGFSGSLLFVWWWLIGYAVKVDGGCCVLDCKGL
jgi:hypothetical protein